MRYIFNLLYRTLTGYRMSIKIGDQTLQRKKVLVDEKDSITEVIIHQGVNKIKDYDYVIINKKLSICVESIIKIINYRIFARDLEIIAGKKIKNIIKIK